MYNPPERPLRPFEADYPRGTSDALSLSRDIEGRTLSAPLVAGRRVVGGADEPVRSADFDRVAAAAAGGPARIVPGSELGRDLGRTRVDPATGLPSNVRLRAGMAAEDTEKVYGHEIGHVIDQAAGQISTKGLSQELRGIFNTLNNPNRKGAEAATWGKPFTPQQLKYSTEEAPREYMAEAVRAYLTNPNYIKTVAPKTAAAIRAAVNTNPRLRDIIQFNVLPAAAIGGGVATGGQSDDGG